jgi:hypothetical protein
MVAQDDLPEKRVPRVQQWRLKTRLRRSGEKEGCLILSSHFPNLERKNFNILLQKKGSDLGY